MNPDLTQIDNIYVDSRITDNVRNFLAAAQAIDSSEHLISGYRSVAYQEELFNSYVSQEMATNPSLTQEAAEDLVKTYSQPAGASEHQTGLAIDMSTVNSLNESDADVVAQVVAIAPEYGFVLRFPEGKSDSTGVDYEDWHFRYVGVESAKYMTENNLTLEEYVSLLKEKIDEISFFSETIFDFCFYLFCWNSFALLALCNAKCYEEVKCFLYANRVY